mmetsp:Transcript_56646/g.121967  ORF Transcript_56646/g.121967 Transcript_56646/m.121967 type:complete len:206 (-) Transcript_56646:39-656(-)
MAPPRRSHAAVRRSAASRAARSLVLPLVAATALWGTSSLAACLAGWRAQLPPRARLCGRRAEEQAVIDALKEFDGDFKAPFDLLDIEDPDAPKAEVRANFRRIVRIEHPDVSERPDAEERFRRISLAYELLMDDGGRAMLIEALERKVEEIQELEETTNSLDEGLEAWDNRWVEDEFSAVFRTTFLIALIPAIGASIWWWGFDHD